VQRISEEQYREVENSFPSTITGVAGWKKSQIQSQCSFQPWDPLMEQSDFVMKPCQSNINQSTEKGGNTRNKMEGPTSKKTKEPPKRANHKGHIKFLNPFKSQEA
jgi:hypothetical protein